MTAVLLSGCSLISDFLPQSPVTTAPTAPATAPTDGAADPTVYHPDGTAGDNLPLFTTVINDVWAAHDQAWSMNYVDALADAGFARSDMQVTTDTTTVDYPAETIQIAVRWGDDECLVGQFGPSTGEPVTMVMPQLAEGRCLIGETIPIEQ